jgi:hypothetical protein
MEPSLFDAAIKGFLNLLHLKVFLAMMVGVSIGTFTAVAPQGLGMPLVYAIALPIVIKWEPITGIALLIGASSVSAICALTCRSFLVSLEAPAHRPRCSTVTRWASGAKGGAPWERLSWLEVWDV